MEMRWISVKERLPEPHINVIACFRGRKVTESIVYHDGTWGLEGLYGKVTHWMPLPEPPKKEDTDKEAQE